MTNYIKDTNPFNLSGPPLWWLTKLYEFDPSLVVMPSKMDCVYRLCQKRPADPRAKLVGDLAQDSDSRMIASHGCIPVTTIISTARWDNPLMWEDLRQRAPWRMGGAEQYEALMDAQDQRRQIDVDANIDARNSDLTKDAWRLYNKKIGLRTHMYSPVVKRNEPVKEQKAPNIIIK